MFQNNVSEKESRWGAKTVAGSGHQESIRLDQLRDQVLKSDHDLKEKQMEHMPKASEGYGGKFGVLKGNFWSSVTLTQVFRSPRQVCVELERQDRAVQTSKSG
jgi:hypothetical protein